MRWFVVALVATPALSFASDGLDAAPSASWSGDASHDAFGANVAGGDFNGDGFADILVPIPGKSSAKVYAGGDGAPSVAAVSTLVSELPAFGFATAIGDVDGDGRMDAAISSEWLQVDVFPGDEAYLGTSPTSLLSEGGQFGNELAMNGDVNGDGFDDLLVGAQGSEYTDGVLYGYFGSGGGLGGPPDIELPYPSGSSGAALSYVGDLDGDGSDDIATAEGMRVSLYTEPTTSDSPDQQVVVDGGLGIVATIAGAMDVNGDGHSDVVEGCDRAGEEESGRAYVFLGNGVGIDDPPIAILAGSAYSSFGVDVASGGDVDLDGFDDILVGARNADNARGALYVFWGEASGPSDDGATRRDGTTDFENFGTYVAGIGDVDGDTRPDVVVTAYAFNEYAGRVDFFAGTDRSPVPVDTGMNSDSGNEDSVADEGDSGLENATKGSDANDCGCGAGSRASLVSVVAMMMLIGGRRSRS